MNNMHLCGWTLNAKPVSCVSREADAAVVKSMVSAEREKAKSLPRSLAALIKRTEQHKATFSITRVAALPLHTLPRRVACNVPHRSAFGVREHGRY
jgi:hypothetical protein